MAERSDTTEKILRAFIQLIAKRGIEATTTRAIADTAGVNEVTIFRNFGDKTNLVRQLFLHYAPVEQINSYEFVMDLSDPQQVAEELLTVICFLRNNLRQRTELLQIGLGEYWHFPELAEQFAATPKAALDLLKRAFHQAEPVLRSEVEVDVAAFNLLSLMLTSVIWNSRGWLQMTEEEWDNNFRSAIRPLINFKGGKNDCSENGN